MGKLRGLVAALALTVTAVAPSGSAPAAAQTASPPACSGQTIPFPMLGHYTGSWHSDADYHFYAHFPAFNGYPASDEDIEMKVTIDGSLDLTVTADGHLSGSASGNVTAPIYHDGQQDISGGVGTISGQVAGVVSPAGSTLVLSRPVIDMHWGTFGGHAVETFPVMPDYQLPVSAQDCVSAGGGVAEQGFPDMNITNDSTGQLTQAPGVGTATGTWSVQSDKAAEFKRLSDQVDKFIQSADSALAATGLTPSSVDRSVVQPLKALETTIQGDSEVSRCLLERLDGWEAAAVRTLLQGATARAGSSDLASLRAAGDLYRAAHALNLDCSVPEGDVEASLLASDRAQVDGAIARHSWGQMALLLRETLLLGGDGARGALQTEVEGDLHGQVQASSTSSSLLDVGRVAYGLHDGADAADAVKRLPAHFRAGDQPPWHLIKPHKKRRTKPTATPTPVPAPKSVKQTLAAGAVSVAVDRPAGAPPTFSWKAVPGATTYVVLVTAQRAPYVLWTWSGSATDVAYGDTALDGYGGSGDGWPVPLNGTAYTWTVLALDAQGRIVGLRLRARP